MRDVDDFDSYLRGMELAGFLTANANRRAEEAFSEAIRRDSSYTDADAFYAIVQVAYGRAADGLTTISEAFARNPTSPYWYCMPLGLETFFLGDYAAADWLVME